MQSRVLYEQRDKQVVSDINIISSQLATICQTTCQTGRAVGFSHFRRNSAFNWRHVLNWIVVRNTHQYDSIRTVAIV